VGIIADMLNGKMPMYAPLQFGVVDVRDVARAHILAIKSDKAPGNRYIVSATERWLKDMADRLSDEFTPQGYKLPRKQVPYAVAWVASFFMAPMENIVKSWGRGLKVDGSKSEKDLGFRYMDVDKSVVETAYALIEMGVVPKTPAYKGAPARE
jgi:nucleoside-diphosphate-sugar epimerase